jgi:protein TonB
MKMSSVARPLIEPRPIMVDFIVPPRPVFLKTIPVPPLHRPPRREIHAPVRPMQPAKAAPAAPISVAPATTLSGPLPILATPTQTAPAPSVPAPSPTQPTHPAIATLPTPPPISAPEFNPAYLRNPAPAYPSQARRLGEQGTVLLKVHVTAEGEADRVQVQDSSGSQRLDRAALEAVRDWRFVPARQGDRAIAAWVVVPIRFKLGD